MSPTAVTRLSALAELRLQRDRLAADLLGLEGEWNRLDAAGDPASFLRAEPIARGIEDIRQRIESVDQCIDARREFDALVSDLRGEFETEAKRVAAISEALIDGIPSEDAIHAAHVRAAQVRRFAVELSELTGEKFRAPDPIGDFYAVVADRRRFIDSRLTGPGHKPAIPALSQRAALNRARALSRP